VKRALDVVLAIAGLALLAPFAVVIGIVIKLESRGPVFYSQKRVGRDGRIFTCWKFRSMRSDAESSGPQWAAKDDARVTRFGRILRRTRIDEFPQMWNVLRNEMSFVGPRPERPFFVDELRKRIPFYMERLLVKPGLTGWAQINYQYGASVADALTKLQHDLYYIKNLSIWLDLLILVRTVKVIVLRRGAV
jgi:exopolysaccharide biosynthesis polyprenyl glycosylphosphotransferase